MVKWLIIWNIVLTSLLVVGFTIGGMVLFNHADTLDNHTETIDNHWEKMTGMAFLLDEKFDTYDEAFLWLGAELDKAFESLK